MCWWVKLTGTPVDLLLSAYRHLDTAKKNIQLELKTMYMHVPLLLERMEFQESRFLAPSKDKLILASLAGDAESDDGSKCCLLLARVT